MIQVIDVNAEQSHHYVEAGSREVTKAMDYRVKARRRYWCITLLSLLFFVAVVGYTVAFFVVPMMKREEEFSF